MKSNNHVTTTKLMTLCLCLVILISTCLTFGAFDVHPSSFLIANAVKLIGVEQEHYSFTAMMLLRAGFSDTIALEGFRGVLKDSIESVLWASVIPYIMTLLIILCIMLGKTKCYLAGMYAAIIGALSYPVFYFAAIPAVIYKAITKTIDKELLKSLAGQLDLKELFLKEGITAAKGGFWIPVISFLVLAILLYRTYKKQRLTK